jgi:hypothetical protein
VTLQTGSRRRITSTAEDGIQYWSITQVIPFGPGAHSVALAAFEPMPAQFLSHANISGNGTVNPLLQGSITVTIITK